MTASELDLSVRVERQIDAWMGISPQVEEHRARGLAGSSAGGGRRAAQLAVASQLATSRAEFPTAFAWTVTCAPKGASDDQLALATMDLHLWFLYLDDYAGADYAELFGALSEALPKMIGGDRGVLETEEAARYPFAHFAAHVGRLAAVGLPMHRYIAERQAALSTYARRNRLRQSGWSPGYAELLELREVTTLFRLWYTLWELLAGFQLSDEQYQSPDFEKAIMATARWHVLVNDIHSVARDAEAGMPNLVTCLERMLSEPAEASEPSLVREPGQSPRDAAIAYLLARCAEQERDIASVVADHPTGALRVPLQFLQHNIEGGRALYRRTLARYQEPL